MGFFRRRRTPLWVWLLALLGIRSLIWKGSSEDRERYREKRRRFREKIGEAFDVWRESDDTTDTTATEQGE